MELDFVKDVIKECHPLSEEPGCELFRTIIRDVILFNNKKTQKALLLLSLFDTVFLLEFYTETVFLL